MGNKLYVGNLDFQTTSDDLSDLFAGAGRVLSTQIITDRDTRRSKGFAFIEMASEAEAQKAITLYNGHLLNARALLVSEARAREAPPSPGAFGRGAQATSRPKFREVKHKARGGRKPRRF